MTNYDEMFLRRGYANPVFHVPMVEKLSDHIRAESLGAAFDGELQAIDKRIEELERELEELKEDNSRAANAVLETDNENHELSTKLAAAREAWKLFVKNCYVRKKDEWRALNNLLADDSEST